MAPKISIDIVSADKSAAGFNSLNERMDAARKRSSQMQDKFDQLRKPIDALTKSFKIFTGRGDLRSTIQNVGDLSGQFAKLNGGVAEAGEGIAGIGAAASTATGLVAGLTAAYAGAIVMGTKFAAGFARSAQEISNTAGMEGVTPRFLQSFRGVAQAEGLDPQSVSSAIAGIGSTLHNIQYGQGDPQAVAALTDLNIRMSDLVGANGKLDVEKGVMLLTDRISKIRDPYTQAHAAQIFGASGALPLMRLGGGKLRQEMNDYWRTGAGQTDDQLDKGNRFAHGLTHLEQLWEGIKKGVATGSMSFLGAHVGATSTAIETLKDGTAHAGAVSDALDGLKRSASEAAHFLSRLFVGGVSKAAIGVAGSGGQKPAGLTGAQAHDVRVPVGTDSTVAGSSASGIALAGEQRGMRRNNPGNLVDARTGAFRRFDNVSDGLAAMSRQLLLDFNRHGLHTIADLINDPHWGWSNEWAPGNSHASSANYIARVSRATGLGPHDQLNLNDRRQLASIEAAMIGVEQRRGNPFSQDELMAAMGGSAPAAEAAPGVRGKVDVSVNINGAPPGSSSTTRYSGDVAVQTKIAKADFGLGG